MDYLDSINKIWYPNGNIKSISFHAEGEIIGKVQYWDSNGVEYLLTKKELFRKFKKEKKELLKKEKISYKRKKYKKPKRRRNSR